jgi:hypothetical protein
MKETLKISSPHYISVGYFNVENSNNIYILPTDQIHTLTELAALGLVETWHTQSPLKLPSSFSNFHTLETQATKATGKGRPSGGIALLLNQTLIKFIDTAYLHRSSL